MGLSRRIFIYDQREIVIFLLLILLFSLFSFTLGVHFGKEVIRNGSVSHLAPASLPTQAEIEPSSQDLIEQAAVAKETLGEEMNKELYDQVIKNNLRMAPERQTDLPKEKVQPKTQSPALPRTVYSLQIGSFATQKEAEQQIARFKNLIHRPFIKESSTASPQKGSQKRYRVFIGEFSSQNQAQIVGQDYVSKKALKNFVVKKI